MNVHIDAIRHAKLAGEEIDIVGPIPIKVDPSVNNILAGPALTDILVKHGFHYDPTSKLFKVLLVFLCYTINKPLIHALDWAVSSGGLFGSIATSRFDSKNRRHVIPSACSVTHFPGTFLAF